MSFSFAKKRSKGREEDWVFKRSAHGSREGHVKHASVGTCLEETVLDALGPCALGHGRGEHHAHLSFAEPRQTIRGDVHGARVVTDALVGERMHFDAGHSVGQREAGEEEAFRGQENGGNAPCAALSASRAELLASGEWCEDVQASYYSLQSARPTPNSETRPR